MKRLHWRRRRCCRRRHLPVLRNCRSCSTGTAMCSAPGHMKRHEGIFSWVGDLGKSEEKRLPAAAPCAFGGEDASWCAALRCAVLLPVGVPALSCTWAPTIFLPAPALALQQEHILRQLLKVGTECSRCAVDRQLPRPKITHRSLRGILLAFSVGLLWALCCSLLGDLRHPGAPSKRARQPGRVSRLHGRVST